MSLVDRNEKLKLQEKTWEDMEMLTSRLLSAKFDAAKPPQSKTSRQCCEPSTLMSSVHFALYRNILVSYLVS